MIHLKKKNEASEAMKKFPKISVTYFSKILEWISRLGTLRIYPDASSTPVSSELPPESVTWVSPLFTGSLNLMITNFRNN